MATTSDLTIIKKHILTKAQYEALETINPNDEYYVIDDDGGNVKYSNEQALSDELKAVALKNIGVDTSISNINTQLESINTSITNIDNTLDTHQSDISTNANDIADLLTGLGDVLNRVDSTDNDIKNLQDKLDAIEGKIPVPEELDKEIVYVDKYGDLAKLTDKSTDKLYFVYEENSIYSYDGTNFVEVSQPSDVIITDNLDEIPNMLLDEGNYSVIHIVKSNEQHNGGELYLESFNNKIQAIKCIKYFKGLSLRDAKTVIDAYPDGFPYLLATGLSDEMLIKYYQDYALFGVTLSYTLNSTESPVAKVAYNLEKGSNSKGGYTYKLSNAESVATYDFEIEEWVWKYYAYDTDIQLLSEIKQDKLTAGDGITISEDGTISASGASITIDTELSDTSTNAVENKVVTAALATKQDKWQVVTVLPADGALLPETLYKIAEIGSVTLTAAQTNKEYFIEFSTGATAPTVTFAGVTFAEGHDSTIEPNKTYNISILNGMGLIAKK